MATTEKPLLHICYAPVDHGWVYGRLLPALGLPAAQVRTRADDQLGEPQLAEIARAVEDCRYTVLVASSATRWDRLAQLAADLAQQATIEHHGPRFFVIMRDAAPGSAAERAELTLSQRTLVGLDCTDEPHTIRSLVRLRRLLALDDPIVEQPACPYPGLERFTAANRHLLFGRDDDRSAILHRIRSGHTRLLVLGPSGSGKSSLIHAAVVPALSPDRYLVRIVPRGGDLAAALRTTIATLEVPGAGAALEQYLADVRGAGDLELDRARRRLCRSLAPDARRRIVVVDPLEEVFVTGHDARATLFDLLSGLWHLPWCTVILCMRADFFGTLMAERCWRELEHYQYAVAPLDQIGLRAAIVEPARHAGVHVEPALVERLIREVDRDRSSSPLPLLQVALEELWERSTWHYLTLETYEHIMSGDQRGLAAVLAIHADAVMQQLAQPGDYEIAQRVLLDLVHLGEGRPHTRRRRTLCELRRSGDPPGQLERVLDALIDGRLVVTGEGDRPAGSCAERHIDLAHDVLITGWSALAAWIQDRQADMVRHRRLEGWAREWVDSGRTSRLLDEAAITDARAWRDSPGGRALGVSDSLIELVEVSAAAHARAAREKAELAACLLSQQRRTRGSIAAAAEIANGIAFQIDTQLQTVEGASQARETLLAQVRRLLGRLHAQHVDMGCTEMAIKAAQADLALQHGDLDGAYRLFVDVGDHAQRITTNPAYVHRRRPRGTPDPRAGSTRRRPQPLDDARLWLEENLVVYATLLDGDPVNAAWRGELAASLAKLGDKALAAARLDDANTWYRSSVAIYETLADAVPGDTRWRRALAATCARLGDVAMAAGKPDEAHRWFDKSAAVRAGRVAG